MLSSLSDQAFDRMTLSVSGELFLRIGALLSIAAGIAHIGIIIGGSPWYRFFGAGEQFAQAAESGKAFPHVVTSLISLVLFLWGAYALSGAGDLPRLPLLKTALVLITGVYLLRGLLFAPLVWRSGHYTIPFIVWSSLICLLFGFVHLIGVVAVWSRL